MDPSTQSMEVELWDSSLVAVWDTSLVSGNKHIATATLRLEEVVKALPFDRGLWKGWLKFIDLQSGFRSHIGRTFQGAADVPANILNTVSLGLIPNSNANANGNGGGGGAAGGEQKGSGGAHQQPSKTVGEVYVEILHVPFIPLEVEQQIDMVDVERLQRLARVAPPPPLRRPRPSSSPAPEAELATGHRGTGHRGSRRSGRPTRWLLAAIYLHLFRFFFSAGSAALAAAQAGRPVRCPPPLHEPPGA